MKLDYYNDFRTPVFHASSAVTSAEDVKNNLMGQFDPLWGGLLLRDDILKELDYQRGELARSSLEEPGTSVILPFSTHLHEYIHWWQHIGTTSGFIYGLSIPVQALATTAYLIECGRQVLKPLIHNVTNKLPVEHPAWLAILRWSEIEYGATFMLSPRTVIHLLKTAKFYESIGHSMLLLYLNSIAALARIADHNYCGLPPALDWIDLYEHFNRTAKPGFSPLEIIDVPLGMKELQEAQARLSELQYLDLSYQSISWAEVKTGEKLSGIYGTALNYYFKHGNLSEPTSVHDPKINLFLVLCDIALNPDEGYPNLISDDGNFVYRTHPGIRFMKLCRILAENQDVLKLLENLSLKSYQAVCEIFCRKAGWATPIEVFERVLTVFAKIDGLEELNSKEDLGDFGEIDVPLWFFLSQHRSFLETKSQVPHFFCWSGSFLCFEENNTEAACAQEVLSWHLPPLMGTLDKGINTANLPQMTEDLQAKFINGYFATQVQYDLVRQWISKRGDFVFRYQWKPRLNNAELKSCLNNFKLNFGLSPFELTAEKPD